MRNTRNYKRKNRRHTRKYKNIKQHKKGGSPEDGNDLIIVGYVRTTYPYPFTNQTTPMIVEKSFSMNSKNYIYSELYSMFIISSNKLVRDKNNRRVMNKFNYFYSSGFYEPNKNHFSEFSQYKEFSTSLSKLNSLPNLKNINIYRLIDRGVSINDLIIGVDSMLADYVDLKYNNISVRKDKLGIITITENPLSYQYIGNEEKYPLSWNEQYKTIQDFKKGIIDSIKIGKIYGEMEFQGEWYSDNDFLKGIEALERSYPTLIARVLLETDAELAGEEPHEIRQSRASRIMEEGMERLKKNTSIPDEIDNIPFIEDEEV